MFGNEEVHGTLKYEGLWDQTKDTVIVPSVGADGRVVIRTADVTLTRKNSFNSGMSSCLKTQNVDLIQHGVKASQHIHEC